MHWSLARAVISRRVAPGWKERVLMRAGVRLGMPSTMAKMEDGSPFVPRRWANLLTFLQPRDALEMDLLDFGVGFEQVWTISAILRIILILDLNDSINKLILIITDHFNTN